MFRRHPVTGGSLKHIGRPGITLFRFPGEMSSVTDGLSVEIRPRRRSKYA